MDAEVAFWLVELGVVSGVMFKMLFCHRGHGSMSDEWKNKH